MMANTIAKILYTCVVTLFATNGIAQNESITCPISRAIGSKQICLPTLSGMTECILKTNVLEYINSRTLNENINIALYVDDENQAGIKDLEHEILESYLLVYTSKAMENENINVDFILELDSLMTLSYRSYIDDYWSIAQDKMREKLATLELDQPVMIDHYNIEKYVPCTITLGRAFENNIERIFLTATVCRVIHGKFTAYAWYLKYDGENSLNVIKSKIAYFSLLLSQINLEEGSISANLKSKIDSKLEEAVEYFNSAYKKSSEGYYEEAIVLYSKAIEAYPSSEHIKKSEAYYNRGINKRLINDNKGAISDYTQAIAIRPDYLKAYHNRGIAKFKSDDYAGAISDFTIIIKSGISDENILASAYGNRGLAKQAINQDSCSDLKMAIEKGSDIFLPYIENCK